MTQSGHCRPLSSLQLRRERNEALEQLAAASEVLKVVSASPGELDPVFQAVLENAVGICEARFGLLFLREGDAFRTVAMHGVPRDLAAIRTRDPLLKPAPGTGRDKATGLDRRRPS